MRAPRTDDLLLALAGTAASLAAWPLAAAAGEALAARAAAPVPGLVWARLLGAGMGGLAAAAARGAWAAGRKLQCAGAALPQRCRRGKTS